MAITIPFTSRSDRAMIFVDGENLAIRYGTMLRQRNEQPRPGIEHEPNVFVWSQSLNPLPSMGTPVMRKYYYTALRGDQDRISEIEKRLKDLEIEAPRVFKKAGDRSKGVDISLATDMLINATRKHYSVGILVAGDGDYVPLVRAVQGEGARVIVWFVSDGLSPALVHAADSVDSLDTWLFPPNR